MKWLFWVLALITVVAAFPAAEAAFRYQGFSSNLVGFDGPSRVATWGDGYSAGATWGTGRSFAYVQSDAFSAGFATQTPRTIVEHRFADHNQNYRTIESGRPIVTAIDVNSRSTQSAFSYRNTPAGGAVSGFFGGYNSPAAGNVYTRSFMANNFNQQFNTGLLSNPWTQSSYRQPSTLTAGVAGARVYY